MAIYYVELNTSVVDGSQYTANDIIVIRAGKRGDLKFQNFNGNGQYITITNEKTTPSTRVEIDGKSGWGCLSVSNCKYIDLSGNNDAGLEYGIKVINDDNSITAGLVWVYGKCDHIKISYLEITCGASNVIANGIFVQDSTLSAAWTWDTFDIHHNYIYNTRYAGMYLGQNDPQENDNAYTARFSIHDNILENMGAYGITYKGINGPNNYIYNNVVKRTGLIPGTLRESAFHGIGVQMTYNNHYVEIYNNWVEKTGGAGFKIGWKNHLIHDNIIVGCGTRNDEMWGHGIVTHTNTKNNEIYDNIIIQAKGYGISNAYGDTTASLKRNLIGDCVLGEFEGGQGYIEGTGADANIYHADVDDFGFKRWSDDGDYSNDDFTISDPCEGVVCDNICIGLDLWSRRCVEGDCVPDQLIESNSASCGYDPCEGVVCENICIGLDLWSQKCEGGSCVPGQLIESNSVTCELCEGVVCGNTCVGDDLWSQRCDPDTGNCVPNQLIQQDSINCKIPDQVPSDESTIKAYIILGGFGIMGLAMMILSKK